MGNEQAKTGELQQHSSIGTTTTPNITKEQEEAIKSLKKDNSIMVLPADKVPASVILDADIYQNDQR